MSSAPSDRNLLIGVLGLQIDLFSADQLATAIKAWASRKSDCLEAILLEQKAITINQFDFLRGIAEKHLAMHNNNPVESLATLSSFALVESVLRSLQDADIDESITRVKDYRHSQFDETLPPNDQALDFSLKTTGTRDRFRILRPHAKGGLGQVSIAEDAELHREVALKEIQPAYASDPESRNRFLIEAELTGRLEHPGIVPVYSLGKTVTGNPFYVMRFIRGDSLKEAIAEIYSNPENLKGEAYRMGLRKLVQRLIDVCNAIEYAHSRGVLHRDLKPGNIMLGKYGETLVVDWGLAKTGARNVRSGRKDEETFIPTSGDGSTETRLGSIVGTPAYMSPEQARGDLEQLGPASDVYSLGATLYSILTGQPPMQGSSRDELIKNVIAGKCEPIQKVNARAPQALIAVCAKAMSLEPARRYSSPMKLAGDLEQWLADEPVSAHREPWLDRTWRFVRRHRTAVVSVVAVLATTLVALTANSLVIQRKNRDLEVARNEAVDAQREAVKEREQAEVLLKTAQDMSIDLWKTAEKTLATLTGQDALLLRQRYTEQALQSLKRLWEQSPKNEELQYEYARILRVSSNLHRLLQHFEIADTLLSESLRLQTLQPIESLSAGKKDHLAETYRELATLVTAKGQLSQAREYLSKARVVIKGLVDSDPTNPSYKRSTAMVDLQDCQIEQELMEFDSALRMVRRVTATYESLLLLADTVITDSIMNVVGSTREIKILSDSGQHKEAIQAADTALATSDRMLKIRPKESNILNFTSRAHYWKAEAILAAGGDPNEALKHTDKAKEILEGLLNTKYLPTYAQGMAETLRIESAIHVKLNDMAQAEKAIQESLLLVNKLVAASDDIGNLEIMANTLEQQALVKEAQKEQSEADELWQKAISFAVRCQKQNSESKLFNKYFLELQKHAK